MVCRCLEDSEGPDGTRLFLGRPASVTLHAELQACLAYTSDERLFIDIWFTMLAIRSKYM